VSRRRPLLLALAVVALLAVVAFAARGRPLSNSGGGTGTGVPVTFWDFVFTTLVIFVAFAMLVGLAGYVLFRRVRERRKPSQTRTLRSLAIVLAAALLLVLFRRHLHNLDLFNLFSPHGGSTHGAGTGNAQQGLHRTARNPRFRWEELVVVLVVLAALGAAAYVTRRRLLPPEPQGPARELLADVLDESLDDLRSDPDLRRAIVAAYARMERTMAAAGVPRDPAEAPLEYLERALLSLDASTPAVRRLTDLFEWARFSQYEPDPSMRDEAVDALVALRDELRASTPVAA